MDGFVWLTIRITFVYACWIGMLATHESGHVLHAWLSGGHVERVVLPWLGFSRTDLSPNPHPLFVAWGGALWGILVPLGLFALAALFRFRAAAWIAFFAGFCLIANGAYLAAGSFIEAGDAGDLLRYGAPHWILVIGGVLGVAAGLALWHWLGLKRPTAPVPAATVDADRVA